MKPRRCLVLAAIAVVLFGLVPLSGVRAEDAPSKIAARLWADTQNGAVAEALVVLRAQADLSPAAALPAKLEKGRFVVAALRAVADRTQPALRAILDQRGVEYQSFYIVNMIWVKGDRALMLDLAARDDVDRLDANPHVATRLPVVTGADDAALAPGTVEWNVDRVRAPMVWALGYRGDGRVVADADTGVDWDHPSLKVHYRGWNGSTADHNYNWHDATAQHSPVPVDGHGHGTFTTSQMVGDDGVGNQVGVAPGAEWIGCRNMDSNGVGSPATYTECFEWLMAPYPIGGDPGQGDPSLAPDSINNSWGCPTYEGCNWNTLQAIVEAVRAAGIFPAVSAGNAGPSCSSVIDPPAIYDASFTVGATTYHNGIASFSSRGPVTVDGSRRLKPDISAPGEGIRGAVPGTGYQSGWSGTSMAGPHVAGGVALLWQAKPDLVGDIGGSELAFTRNAVPRRTIQRCGFRGIRVPNNTFGWGLLDLYRAASAP